MAKVLIIDDNDTMREGLVQVIKKMGHDGLSAINGHDGVEIAEKNQPDIVITDFKMDGLSGMDVLMRLKEKDPDVVVIIITGYGTIDVAVDAMKQGAFDFVTKPFSPEVFRAKVDSAVRVRNLAQERNRFSRIAQYYQENDNADVSFEGIVGTSPALKDILDRVKKVAPTDASVLITGESGTGKEMVARAIHNLSNRKDKPFIKVNCGSLAESLLESELFGHEKGAFTGAVKRRMGRFELADGGTIFLDEIGDFSLNIQLKLLRVLQEREFERVGGTDTLNVDVRVISATNKNLQDEMKTGRFREDLYYRLHIVPIQIPSLRERQSDIPQLVSYFVNRLNEKSNRQIVCFTKSALDSLQKYPWPGNIRELENVVEQSYVLSTGNEVDVTDLPMYIQEPSTDLLKVPQGTLSETLEKLERQLIERAYKKANGVKAETARLLGVKTSALYYKLEKYGLIKKGSHLDEGDM